MTACWVGSLPLRLQEKDFVFTDDLDKVPFGASSGRLFFLEGLGSEVNERPMPRQGHGTWQKQRIEIGGGFKKATTFIIFYLGRSAFGIQSFWVYQLVFSPFRWWTPYWKERSTCCPSCSPMKDRCKIFQNTWTFTQFPCMLLMEALLHWGCFEHDQTV